MKTSKDEERSLCSFDIEEIFFLKIWFLSNFEAGSAFALLSIIQDVINI